VQNTLPVKHYHIVFTWKTKWAVSSQPSLAGKGMPDNERKVAKTTFLYSVLTL
jgi:hypothetical protein